MLLERLGPNGSDLGRYGPLNSEQQVPCTNVLLQNSPLDSLGEEMSENSKSSINNSNPWRRQAMRDEELASKAWGILLFGVIGATATTLAVCQLRRTGDWFYSQLNKSQSNSSWRSGASSSCWESFREEARKRYYRQLQREYEEEMERVERIRRMQRAFKRERDKYRRSYEAWREYGPGAYQHFQQDEGYWHTDTSYGHRSTKYWSPQYSGNHSMSHHYSVLGLDRSRDMPYSDAEIKTAFRATAMKYHPDQNQGNKEAAEAKFKEVMASYEAIKLERGNTKC